MKQLVQLQEHLPAFKAAGIAVVALTYDAPELQQQFIEKGNITYPLLSDVGAVSIKALGILNDEFEPGDRSYGIPYPGIFIVNDRMEIVGKIFVEGYRYRVDAPHVLEYAQRALN